MLSRVYTAHPVNGGRAPFLPDGRAAAQASSDSTSAARRSQTASVSSAVGASTITRTSGSVPLGRTSTRPRPDSSACAAATAAAREAIEREAAALEGRGRVLVRPSGTEPLVRVMVEAPTAEEADATCERLVAAVENSTNGGEGPSQRL